MKPNASAKAFTLFKDYALYFVLLMLLVVIVSKDTSFLSLTNFSNILTQSSVRVIIALGVAGLIVTQGTDLSVGRQVGLAVLAKCRFRSSSCWLPPSARSSGWPTASS